MVNSVQKWGGMPLSNVATLPVCSVAMAPDRYVHLTMRALPVPFRHSISVEAYLSTLARRDLVDQRPMVEALGPPAVLADYLGNLGFRPAVAFLKSLYDCTVPLSAAMIDEAKTLATSSHNTIDEPPQEHAIDYTRFVQWKDVVSPGNRRALLKKLRAVESGNATPLSAEEEMIARDAQAFRPFYWAQVLELARRYPLRDGGHTDPIYRRADLLFLFDLQDPDFDAFLAVQPLEDLLMLRTTVAHHHFTRVDYSNGERLAGSREVTSPLYHLLYSSPPVVERWIFHPEAFRADYAAIRAGKTLPDFVRERGWDAMVFLSRTHLNTPSVILSRAARGEDADGRRRATVTYTPAQIAEGLARSEPLFEHALQHRSLRSIYDEASLGYGHPSLIALQQLDARNALMEYRARAEYETTANSLHVVAVPGSLVLGLHYDATEGFVPHYIPEGFVIASGRTDDIYRLVEGRSAAEQITHWKAMAEGRF